VQVYGNIATNLERKSSKNGTEYFVCRLAENTGKGEARQTTWYDVIAFINPLEAELLGKGQFVKVTGRIQAKVYQKRDGAYAAALELIAWDVEPVEKKAKAPAE
jgi:single-stranded DNA-binding protein